jgi:hypothetical protein
MGRVTTEHPGGEIGIARKESIRSIAKTIGHIAGVPTCR